MTSTNFKSRLSFVPRLLAILVAIVLLLVPVAVNSANCDDISSYAGTFTSEKGNFRLSWCFPDTNVIQFSLSLDGLSYIALGFGGAMYDADIIAGWVDSQGNVVINDYYANAEAAPKTDISLGGHSDVQLISGTRTATTTTLVFTRKLTTGDSPYDKDISLTAPNDMIYAWNNNGNGQSGLSYHADNHNHVFIDFSRPNGIPSNEFGYEESGQLSRAMVRDGYYGTLSTFQTQAAGSSQVANVPYGSVADFVDDGFGQPLILLSNLERNVINLQTIPMCSLAINSQPNSTFEFSHPELFDVMTQPRTTLLGKLVPVPSEELPAAQALYLAKHPKSKAWIGFSDFTMYRMSLSDVYVVGGFGNEHYIGWISPEQYLNCL